MSLHQTKMEMMVEPEEIKKKNSLTCAEIGLLVAGYRIGSNELSVPNDMIYIATLIIFDLYEENLIELYIRVNNTNISLKTTDSSRFQILETIDKFDTIYSLLIQPSGRKPPKRLPDGEAQFYSQIIDMSSMFGGLAPIILFDLLLCCKSRLDFNLCIINCRNWILAELEAKKILEISRKLLVFSKYTLTEEGNQYCMFLTSRVNYVLTQQYQLQPEDFPQYTTSTNFQNVYFVCHLIIHLGKKYLQKSTNISNETRKKFITYQASLANNIGNLLRQPQMKLQPADMESWFVAMCAATGICAYQVIRSTSKY